MRRAGQFNAGTLRWKAEAGATLVELLVVVAVLGVLVGAVLLRPSRPMDHAVVTACQAELDVVEKAVRAANLDRQPVDPEELYDGDPRWFTWSGSPGNWTINAVGPVPFGC